MSEWADDLVEKSCSENDVKKAYRKVCYSCEIRSCGMEKLISAACSSITSR